MMIDFASRILQRMPDMVAYLDTELRYRYTNHAYQKELQKSGEEFIGKTVFEILPEEVIALATPRWQEALKGKEVAYDTRVTATGGGIKQLFVRLVPEFQEDGLVAGFFIFISNITRRKDVESRLHRLRALNDDLPSLLAHCDAQQCYIYVNRAYAATYGRTPETILGMHVWEVVSPQLYEQIKPHITRLLQGEAIEFEVVTPHADGRRPWMAIRGIPERVGNEVVGFFINASDITKHKELEALRREFVSTTVRAQEAERKALAQELHDGIAQELAALALLSNMLERKSKPEQTEAILRMLQDGLQRTVDETRRLSYGLHPLELHERGFINAVNELVNRTGQVHSKVEIDIRCNKLVDEITAVPELSVAIYRIIQESLSNALRHASPSRIQLSLNLEDNKVIGAIEDNGTGFDVDLPHTGLGLSSMKDRALFLGGNLRIHSDGTGTRIEFVVPTAPAPRP